MMAKANFPTKTVSWFVSQMYIWSWRREYQSSLRQRKLFYTPMGLPVYQVPYLHTPRGVMLFSGKK